MPTPQRTVEHRPATTTSPPLELQRSRRRRRSATAYVRDGRVVVQLPAGLAPAEEARLVTTLVARATRADAAERAGGDEELAARAVRLADAYLDGARPSSIRWSGRMRRRYGSCTTSTGEIRISREVARFPPWVQDDILLHELAHLVVPDHSPAFHALADRHPRHAEARAWVAGWEAGRASLAEPLAPPAEQAPAGDEAPAAPG